MLYYLLYERHIMVFGDPKKAAKEIAPIFKEMQWTWYYNNIPPTEGQIYSAFIEFEKGLKESTAFSVETGRLYAEMLRDKNEIIYIHK